MKIGRFILLLGLYLVCSVSAAANDNLFIPSEVTYIYVFLQSPTKVGRDTGRDIDTVSPADFRKNLIRYQQMAKKESMKLVVAAETADRRWVQDRILYNGSRLPSILFYNPGTQKMHPGGDFPLD